jgi:hypothetical protein
VSVQARLAESIVDPAIIDKALASAGKQDDG